MAKGGRKLEDNPTDAAFGATSKQCHRQNDGKVAALLVAQYCDDRILRYVLRSVTYPLSHEQTPYTDAMPAALFATVCTACCVLMRYTDRCFRRSFKSEMRLDPWSRTWRSERVVSFAIVWCVWCVVYVALYAALHVSLMTRNVSHAYYTANFMQAKTPSSKEICRYG